MLVQGINHNNFLEPCRISMGEGVHALKWRAQGTLVRFRRIPFSLPAEHSALLLRIMTTLKNSNMEVATEFLC